MVRLGKRLARGVALFFVASGMTTVSRVQASGPTFTAWPSVDLVKIFPDALPPPEGDRSLEIHAVRNEFAPFQIAVTAAQDISDITVSVSGFKGKNASIPFTDDRLYLAANVTLAAPSMNSARRVWPDPLPPFRPFTVPAGETRAAWADLFVPADAAPGRYEGTATVSAAGSPAQILNVSLVVHDAEIPSVPTIRTAFGIRYGDVQKAHGLADDDSRLPKLLDAYYWFMADHRLSPYHIPVDLFSDEAEKYLDDPRVNFLRAPYSKDDAEMARIAARLKDRGWMDKAAFYMVDEPAPDEYPRINEIGKRLHSFDPELKFLLTTGNVPGLEEAGIQIWCPVITFTMDPSAVRRIRKEQEAGRDFWWYTCIGPKWEGTTYFIDDSATAPRLHPWMNRLYGATGILYWSVTAWGRAEYDPWTHPETYPGGNGDGSLLYPGTPVGVDGPVASIRIKELREGMEDYELLGELERKMKGLAAVLGNDAAVLAERRTYEHAFGLITEQGRSHPLGKNAPLLQFVTRDPEAVESRRRLVIREIEQASVLPAAMVAVEPPDSGYTRADAAVVKGLAEPGSTVFVNGVRAGLRGTRFATKVPLKSGRNEIEITVEREGSRKTLNRVVYRKP